MQVLCVWLGATEGVRDIRGIDVIGVEVFGIGVSGDEVFGIGVIGVEVFGIDVIGVEVFGIEFVGPGGFGSGLSGRGGSVGVGVPGGLRHDGGCGPCQGVFVRSRLCKCCAEVGQLCRVWCVFRCVQSRKGFVQIGAVGFGEPGAEAAKHGVQRVVCRIGLRRRHGGEGVVKGRVAGVVRGVGCRVAVCPRGFIGICFDHGADALQFGGNAFQGGLGRFLRLLRSGGRIGKRFGVSPVGLGGVCTGPGIVAAVGRLGIPAVPGLCDVVGFFGVDVAGGGFDGVVIGQARVGGWRCGMRHGGRCLARGTRGEGRAERMGGCGAGGERAAQGQLATGGFGGKLLAHQVMGKLCIDLRWFGPEKPVFADNAPEELGRFLDNGERVLETFCGAGEGAVGNRQDLVGTDHELLTFIRIATECLPYIPRRKVTESVPYSVSFRDLIVVCFPERL